MSFGTPLIVTVLLLGPGLALGQTLPTPSRTVFKCTESGVTVYSDAPCVGAQKLEIEPTRGVNRTTGKERTGKDVHRELQREAMAEAIRPITGMDAKQFETAGRRMKLSADTQRECRKFDRDIPALESQERRAQAAELARTQQDLFRLRSRFAELRC
jgi:hypothetical protein